LWQIQNTLGISAKKLNWEGANCTMKKIIHLSDLHFRQKWEESQNLVIDSFFSDLSKQVKGDDRSDVYIAFSGDFVLRGHEAETYGLFLQRFDKSLNELGIPKEQRISVPGNHDVSQDFLKQHWTEHNGVVSQQLDETKFNDYISAQPEIIIGKFKNYNTFETRFAALGINGNTISGAGWNIEDNIGVYCLNTAVFSSGDVEKTNDRGKLSVDTRCLQKWISDCGATAKILIMHHPLDWLTIWSEAQLKATLHNKFALCLSGHAHEQSIYHYVGPGGSLVECSAPPLLTNKNDRLGYAIITVCEKGVIDIQYRQWTRGQLFVTGVDFSGTDDGKVVVKDNTPLIGHVTNDNLYNILEKRWMDALQSFSSQPIVWVDPILSKTNSVSKEDGFDSENSVPLADVISSPKSTIIKAPPQFGLTSLSHYLAKEAWDRDSSLWLYLDSKNIKSHNVDKAVKDELENLGVNIDLVKCIILDSWTDLEKDSFRLLDKLCKSQKDIPVIVMQTVDDSRFLSDTPDEAVSREFEVLYMLPLPRSHVRKVVAAYNEIRHIGDEDNVITKVVSDLEVLNIHRTPFNCLTLLKVSEKYFDESPVNRTQMLEMVLFLLFDMEGIPKYKTKPDVKDCEFVLGHFCEQMIKTSSYSFSREVFLSELRKFCEQNLLELEVEIVFDILYWNHIIIKRATQYCFRASYWIMYFAAKRMYQDKDFANYILADNRYTSFPEIIEFYTGIDRRRDDALEILVDDLRKIYCTVKTKLGLPEGMNPYNSVKWLPSGEDIQRMKEEIKENVLNSGLPISVKDRYADLSYDSTRPYYQSIHQILHEYSVAMLKQSLIATSRALRNSDYVSPERKRELLSEIMKSWQEMSTVIMVLAPILAEKDFASLEGVAFVLGIGFEGTIEEKFEQILMAIPQNIVKFFADDLFSGKMGPLLFEQLAREKSELVRHQLVTLIVRERPLGWRKHVEDYIARISKNSFYLMDLIGTLQSEYSYAFMPPGTVIEIGNLIKMGLAKHDLGIAKPGIDRIKQIANSFLPKRQVDDDMEPKKK
jgi:predicted MPP superfamily phosphohydrolase